MESKDLFLILLGMAVVSTLLPSLVTQANWLSEDGLLPVEKRRTLLLFSWILALVIIALIWKAVKE